MAYTHLLNSCDATTETSEQAMPSERLQRQIDRLLDETEAALVERDWARVRTLAGDVLRLDPENVDARAFLDACERGGSGTNQVARSQSAAASAPPDPLPASFAGGRYAVRRFLGEGGRKRVYLAHDTRLDRDVAVAIIKTEGLDAAGRGRVQREAQSMARLGDQANIVTVHDVGEDGDQSFIVSQYMAGGSVEDLMAKADEHRLPVEQTLQIADQICQALEFAHRKGIVHRDLKPGNVWLAEDGTAKLGDFGLAVALDRSRVTMAGTMLGTVAYMPPEQALGGESTLRADLYSLGCMLYELVTGRPPFLGDDPTAVISQHINTPPVAPSWLTDRCPPGLEEVILNLLAKAPDDRPASADDVRDVLSRVDPAQKSASHSDSSENPLDRLARGVFVGRHNELDKLRKAFDGAFAGHGSLVMLVGEPGIGKTRTAQELETYARIRGASVLWGRTHESSGAPAYWPWYQVGNAYAATNDLGPIGQQLPPGTNGELSRIFPWLRQQPNFIEPEPITDPESAQFRLFEAYAAFIRAMASQTPLLIAIDDLHWADKPSLLLLQHIAHEVSRLRVLIVGNFRDTDLSRTHPLSEALAGLNRDPGFARVVLRGLTQPEVATYIHVTANVEPKPELVRHIFEETEGNPFFLSEVVNLMAQEGTLTRESVSDIRIPDGVREALGRRLDRVSEETNELLQVCAVVGREFTFDTLTLLGDREEDEIVRRIEEALRARVIEELDQPGRYRFTHALMQETLLDELSTTRRVRLHGQVGEALEKRWGTGAEERAARLAQHFVEAATLTPRHAERALRYSRLAAEQAEAQSAWDEAARHYEHCLTLVGEAAGPLKDTEPDLLIASGRSLRCALEPRAAWRNLMRAITLCKQRGDAVGVARATLEAARIPAPPGRTDALLREAVDLLGDADPYLEAHLILARARPFGDRLGEAEVRRIEEILQHHDFPDVAAALSCERGMVALGDMRFDDAWREYDRAYDGLLKHGRMNEAGYIIFVRGIMPLMLGDLVRGKQVAEDALRRTREIHAGFWEVNLLLRLAGLALARGQAQEFQELLEQIVPNYGRDLLRVAQAELSGDLVRAQALLPAMEAAGGVPSWVAQVHAARARILLHLGDTEAATAELNAFKSALDGMPKSQASIGRLYPTLEADEAIALLGALDAREFYEELVGCAPLRWEPFVLSGADRIRGALAMRLGLIDEAEMHFQDGLDWSQHEGLSLEAGRCLLRLADIEEARGETRSAFERVDRAIGLFREFGTKLHFDLALAMKLRLQGLLHTSMKTSIDSVAETVEAEKPPLPQGAVAPDGTVTIMFSDIEDSTVLTERLGDPAWQELLRKHNSLIREQLKAYGGYEVKTMGDGFMVAFQSAKKGLDCAIAIQKAFDNYNAAEGEHMKVRIGLHAGEAIKDGDDFYGKNVILASRVAGKAAGGEILVSSLLRQLVESSTEAALFGEPRQVELKGLSGTHVVYAVAPA
jgi:eukaryotic-like serine/threonine-protein kinase